MEPHLCLRGTLPLVLTLLLSNALAFGEQPLAPWELHICADPHAFPASSQEHPGYDNRIAELLARELGAEPVFVWEQANPNTVQTVLNTGACDLMMGLAEGAAGLATTVAYLRAPYVFVQRADAPFDVTALDDPALADLSIATYHQGPPRRALQARGLSQNVVVPEARATDGGPDFVTPALEALVRGEVDLAMLYGPDVVSYEPVRSGTLEFHPILPEIAPPLLPMFRILTIGVRSGDEALRDRLEIALTRRWDDVQAVLDEYEIPQQPVPRPRNPGEPLPTVRIGAVLPLPTGNPNPYGTIATAAHTGLLLAEDQPAITLDGTPTVLDVKTAHAPDPQAVRRSAERLVATEGVHALVGGFDLGSTLVLADVARRHGIPFMNIAATEDTLRDAECLPNTFHVEVGARIYIEAALQDLLERGAERVFLVHEESERGAGWLAAATAAAARVGLAVTGEDGVPPGSFGFRPTVEIFMQSGAEAVMVMLAPQELEFFLSQLQTSDPGAIVGLLAHPVTQTREFFFRFAQFAPDVGTQPRPLLWDATLAGNAAQEEFNSRFAGRSGQPADPTGWSAFAAAVLVLDAAQAAGSTNGRALLEALRSTEVTADLLKGGTTTMDPSSQQLVQPLFRVELDPEAAWANAVSARIAVGTAMNVIEELPFAVQAVDREGHRCAISAP